MPIALTIAGSDSSGGAGLQADLKTFAAFRVYGTSVVTALTAQSTRAVEAVADVDAGFVGRQLDAVFGDLSVDAAKTWMLARAAVIEVVAERLAARRVPLVIDPVLVATSGHVLLEPEAVATLRRVLLPLATLVTPNLHEAEVLSGRRVADVAGMRDAARALVDLGARAAVVTGGHLPGAPVDVLCEGGVVHELSGERVGTGSRHGTGCTFSAAVTACLAHGDGVATAIDTAKRWVAAVLAAPGTIGHGAPPLDHGSVTPRR